MIGPTSLRAMRHFYRDVVSDTAVYRCLHDFGPCIVAHVYLEHPCDVFVADIHSSDVILKRITSTFYYLYLSKPSIEEIDDTIKTFLHVLPSSSSSFPSKRLRSGRRGDGREELSPRGGRRRRT